jgi:hypothetical protein
MPPDVVDALIADILADGSESVLGELVALNREVRLSGLAVAIGNSGKGQILENWPNDEISVPRGILSGSTAWGASFALAAATATQLVGRAPGRLGGSAVNSGANPVTLYLGSLTDLNAGKPQPQLWLAGTGGAWDFRVSGMLWVGDVCAISTLGTTVAIGVL